MKLKELLEKRDALNETLAAEKEKYETAIAATQEELNTVEVEIGCIIDEPVKQARLIAGKDTGTVDVLIDGVMVKHVVNKSVNWDQEKLAQIWAKIMKSGDDPKDYINANTKYKVSEKTFKHLMPEIKNVFDPARTVEPGAVKITFNIDRR